MLSKHYAGALIFRSRTANVLVRKPDVDVGGTQIYRDIALRTVAKLSQQAKDFSARLMLPLSLSYDHRVIDGADGARFVTFINGVLSDLRRLVM